MIIIDHECHAQLLFSKSLSITGNQLDTHATDFNGACKVGVHNIIGGTKMLAKLSVCYLTTFESTHFFPAVDVCVVVYSQNIVWFFFFFGITFS